MGVTLVILFDKRVRYVKKVKNHWFGPSGSQPFVSHGPSFQNNIPLTTLLTPHK